MMKINKNHPKRSWRFAWFVGLLVFITSAWQVFLKYHHENAFEKIQVGDSIAIVIEHFGTPSKTGRCPANDPPQTPKADGSDPVPNCKVQLLYRYSLVFLDSGMWIIDIDDRGKVSEKRFTATR